MVVTATIAKETESSNKRTVRIRGERFAVYSFFDDTFALVFVGAPTSKFLHNRKIYQIFDGRPFSAATAESLYGGGCNRSSFYFESL
jgi:hypothetical protein